MSRGTFKKKKKKGGASVDSAPSVHQRGSVSPCLSVVLRKPVQGGHHHCFTDEENKARKVQIGDFPQSTPSSWVVELRCN